MKLLKLVCTGLLLMAGVSHAENTHFVVGVEDLDYFPHYANEGGSYKGYAREVLDAFAKKSGYTFEYKMLPVKRLFGDFLDKQSLDFKYPDNAYWSANMREGKTIHYSDAVTNVIDGAIVKPENKGKGVDAIKSIGAARGFTAWSFLDLINQGKVKLVENNSMNGIIQQTLNGRVGATYGNLDVINYKLSTVLNKPGSLVFDPDLPHAKTDFKLSTFKHKEIIEQLNQFLVNEKAQVDAIKEKYQVM